MTSAAVLGIAFVLVGCSAAFLMMYLWGFPYDEVRRKSEAPRSLELLHRALGWTFAALYVAIMWRMVPRLWMYEGEFPARTAIHAFLGVSIGAVLFVKIAIVRFYPAFHKYLHAFGIALLLLTLTALALPLAYALREWHLGRGAQSAESRAALRARLAAVEGIGPERAAALSAAGAVSAGRERFLALCMQCHDSRAALSQTRSAAEWIALAERMAENSEAPGYHRISSDAAKSIAAYLTAIRGRDADAAPVAASSTAGAGEPAAIGTPAAPRSEGGDVAAVEALFKQSCAKCHTGPRAKGGMVLETAATAIASGAVLPGDVAGSPLLRAVRGETDLRMPLKAAPLSSEQIATLEAWVRGLGEDAAEGTAAPGKTAPSHPAAAAMPAAPSTPAPGEPIRFDHVEPILIANCARCHSANGEMGAPPEGLKLDAYADSIAGGERPAIIPGNPGASILLRHIRGLEAPRMPFDGPPWLSDEEAALIERWITGGAPDAAGGKATIPAGRQVRLTGTLTARWAIDGVPFHVAGGTEIRDAAVGSRVEVRAFVREDGGLEAERVRGR